MLERERTGVMPVLKLKEEFMDNLISVIIPAYNVEKFIGDCLQSVQAQTYENWQAIVVDDGSTDKTAEVIRSITEQDERFQFIQQSNGGVSKARNTGILAATGTYMAFLDGDDMWAPNFLSELLDTIQTNQVDMVYCGYTHLYTNGLRRKFSYSYVSGRILHEIINGKTQVHIGAVLVKKEIIDQSGLLFTEGCRVGQDQEFIWKLASHVTIRAVPQELMIYRIRSKSAVTSKWKWQNHIHAIYGFRRAAEYILQQSLEDYDHQKIKQALHERIAFKLYRFIWRMIKHGYHEDASKIINSGEFQEYLAYLEQSQMKWLDKLKYKIVSSQNQLWWELAKFL